MKKFLFFASALAGLFLAASCQRESLEPEVTGGVTYEISLPDGPQTKGEAGYATYSLHYEVYKTAGNAEVLADTPLLFDKTVEMTGNKTTVTLDLLNDQDYTVLFWANKKGTDYFDIVDGRSDLMAVKVKQATSNNDDRDAFCGMDQIVNHDAAQSKTVTLTRPFAQLNIATLVSTNDYDIKPQSSLVKLTSIPTAYNVFTGKPVGENTEVTYTVNWVPDGNLTVNGTEYKKVAMNYLLVPESNISVYYEINTVNGTVKNTIENVPVKKNYRTNIIGNLLTSNATYTVEIKPGFEEGDEIVEVWNGSELKAPAYDDATKTYSIEMASELAWLAAAVNGTLPNTKATLPAETFQGKTFILTKNIDLNNKEWTPIGNNTNKFQGTFDGNGKTVKNLVITGNNNYVGLFGFTTNGEIKNLTVENAKVSGRNSVGVVAGSPYTSKYTNITVKGHVEVNGKFYVGGVGGRNAYADWTNVKVEADETSYVNANSVENGTAYRTYVGGVVGFNGEGGHSFKNITSNIDVKGSTIDVGGLFGIAHYQNVFENLKCTGDVVIYAAEESAEAEEIGGIAGVWMDSEIGPVTFTNIEFTGAVTTNIERETIWYDNLFGKPYNNNGKGKLIVDGCEMVANGVGLLNGEYYISSPAGLVWVEAQEDKFFAGKTIKLAKDIDMAGVTIEKPIHFWSGRTTFDGQDHTISNLTMSTESTEKKPFGLFGGTADIKNLKFDNANISGYSYVAVVAGNLYGNIDNCHVANSTVTCRYWMAGAMSGQYNAGNVTNCSVTNTTVTGPAAVGALVGNINETSGERRIENCTVTECVVNQNGSFGGDYDDMFASVVGLINIDNSNVYFTGCTVENNTVKGEDSDSLYGLNSSDDTIVYINGEAVAVTVAEGVSQAGDTYIVTADEGLAWIAKNVSEQNGFEGKTIKLETDVDLATVKTMGDSFAPIGSTGERDDRNRLVCEPFKGTFDGNGKTVKNVHQSGWDFGYEWGQYGSIGLFSELEGATVKNVVLEGFDCAVEGGDVAFIAGSATGDCVFENIEIKSGGIGTYNNGIGSIIGWSGAGNYTFKNIKIGSDVILGGLWGSFDSSVGGLVGQAEPGASYHFEDVEINCQLDVYNDVTAAYKYYIYRMSGMIIGRCEETTTIDGRNYPDLSKYNITCKNVTVNYGDWMNYHYCVVEGKTAWRHEAGYAYDGIPADHDHSTCAMHHDLCLPFDGLFGGDQYGVNPIKEYPGVTVNYPASYNPEN